MLQPQRALARFVALVASRAVVVAFVAFVAPAALFLASSASGDLTGEVLAVAGNKLSTWRMHESRGVVGDDPRTPWAADEIRKRWYEVSRSVGDG